MMTMRTREVNSGKIASEKPINIRTTRQQPNGSERKEQKATAPKMKSSIMPVHRIKTTAALADSESVREFHAEEASANDENKMYSNEPTRWVIPQAYRRKQKKEGTTKQRHKTAIAMKERKTKSQRKPKMKSSSSFQLKTVHLVTVAERS